MMTSSGLVTVRPDDDLALAAQLMSWSNVRHLPVVARGEVVGIVSERDLLGWRQLGAKAAGSAPIEDVMRRPPVTVDADAPLATAVSVMVGRNLGCLPVLDQGQLVGIITTTDLLRRDLDAALQRPADQLPTPVRAYMTPSPAVVMATNELFDAAALMSARGVRHLPVVDAERRVLGVLSDRDVRAALGDPRRFLNDPDARDRFRETTAGAVMSAPAVTVRADAPITSAIDHLLNDDVGALPVVADDGKLVGTLSYVDVVRAMRDRLT